MKRFLIPLLAALALPSAVNAESYSLVLTTWMKGKGYGAYTTTEITNFTFSTYGACQEQGERWSDRSDNFGYHCFKGE